MINLMDINIIIYILYTVYHISWFNFCIFAGMDNIIHVVYIRHVAGL